MECLAQTEERSQWAKPYVATEARAEFSVDISSVVALTFAPSSESQRQRRIARRGQERAWVPVVQALPGLELRAGTMEVGGDRICPSRALASRDCSHPDYPSA
jgi:hypothetical protein